MLKVLRTVSSRHEDVFVERYQKLLNWCLRLTDRDRQQAEDLIQDGFIQFTLSRPDLDAIQNLDGYLFTLLRNLRLSKVRRSGQTRPGFLSLTDFDSAAAALRVADHSVRLQSQCELVKIGEYALRRRGSSRAGSVLILRYFLGYYPAEVGQIIGGQRRAVDDYLRVARAEAKTYLSNYSNHRAQVEAFSRTIPFTSVGADTAVFLSELAATIFRSATGDCISLERLRDLYRQSKQLDCGTLSHLVCCRQCLDMANRLLGLPLLADRLPADNLGRDWPPKSGDGGATPFRGTPGDRARVYRRRARETFEHKPSELRISVNGFTQGSQKVNSARNQQTLTIHSAEKIAFLQVLSEQEIQLLFTSVDPPPDGEVEQGTRVQLSEGRSLQLSIDFSGPWPVVEAIYLDPGLAASGQLEIVPASSVENILQPTVAISGGSNPRTWLIPAERFPSLTVAIKGLIRRLTDLKRQRGRRALIVATACIVIVALVIYEVRTPSVSAAELLDKSAASDRAIYENPNLAVHRTLDLQGVRLPDKQVITQRKIEIWRNSASGVTVRRLTDENGNLIAGEWTRPNESPKVYYTGDSSREENIWRLDVSANTFSSVIERGSSARVRRDGDGYTLTGTPLPSPVTRNLSLDLLGASIVLNTTSLHPMQETLVIRKGGATWEYRLREVSFHTAPASTVDPRTFEVDPAFSTGAGTAINRANPVRALFEAQRLRKQSQLALEVEVLHRLDQVGATTNDRVTLERQLGGKVLVQGVVETIARKEEIQRTLDPLMQNPLLRSNVQTVSEALQSQGNGPGDRIYQGDLEVTKASIPVYSELSRYFSSQLDRNPSLAGKDSKAAWIDSQIRQFSDRVVEQSIQATLHAEVLKDLANRFTPDDLKEMKPEVRAKWQEMVRDHAQTFEQQCRLIRLELRPIFFTDSPLDQAKQASKAEADPNGDPEKPDMVRVTGQLFRLAVADEKAIRMAFTVSGQSPTAQIASMQKLWPSLLLAEKLALRFSPTR